MPLFQPFKAAPSPPRTPQFLDAEIRATEIANQNKQAERAMRSQNVLGAGALYNTGMEAAGKAPISDFLQAKFGAPDTAGIVAAKAPLDYAPVFDTAANAGTAAALDAGAGNTAMTMAELGLPEAATGAAELAGLGGGTGAAASVAPAAATAAPAATTAAGAAGASAPAWLSTLGPAGIALALGSLLFR